jgi:hypothetical protein
LWLFPFCFNAGCRNKGDLANQLAKGCWGLKHSSRLNLIKMTDEKKGEHDKVDKISRMV